MDVNLETPQDIEQNLVQQFGQLEAEVASATLRLKELTKVRDEIESQLMELLDDENKKSSARFDGIGHVTIVKPRPYASIALGQDEILFEHLTEIGREDLIKTTVNASALSALLKQCLESNQDIPPGITYYFKSRLAFYPQK